VKNVITRKDLIVVVLATFCLTTMLFIILPSRSSPSPNEYNPWVDVNDDGIINIVDITEVARLFGTTGTSINKTALLLELQSQIQNLEAKVQALEVGGETLSQIYESVKDSVVMIKGTISGGTVQGSGFVYDFNGSMFVVTNNHVVHGTTSLSVTFSDGDGYAATVKGTDPYADLAVLTVNAPETEFKPIEVVSSSTLNVGDVAIAVGNPYGLISSMTTGIVSALGRTITEQEYTGGYAIANIIQTSTPINPGNSGGPLLDSLGRVIGITAAIVADSQGLGFAVPSSTLLKEIVALVENGTYDQHSYLGTSGADMDYEEAQNLSINLTYGWRIVTITPGGPVYNAGLQSGDIIISMNSTRIRDGDEMSSYLEEKTLPGETLVLGIFRTNNTLEKTVILGKRPAPPAG
jgi:S1-C subfamily serine protease